MTETVMQWPLVCMTLAAVAVLFPEEFYSYAETAYFKVKISALNIQLFVRSYLIYRRLKLDFDRLQIPAPPFHFTPIQDRR